MAQLADSGDLITGGGGISYYNPLPAPNAAIPGSPAGVPDITPWRGMMPILVPTPSGSPVSPTSAGQCVTCGPTMTSATPPGSRPTLAPGGAPVEGIQPIGGAPVLKAEERKPCWLCLLVLAGVLYALNH
jgi:hypothetical protein